MSEPFLEDGPPVDGPPDPQADRIEKLYLALMGVLQAHPIPINTALGAVARLQINLNALVMEGCGFMRMREPQRTMRPSEDESPESPGIA